MGNDQNAVVSSNQRGERIQVPTSRHPKSTCERDECDYPEQAHHEPEWLTGSFSGRNMRD